MCDCKQAEGSGGALSSASQSSDTPKGRIQIWSARIITELVSHILICTNPTPLLYIYGIFQVKSAAQNFKNAQNFFTLSIL